MGTNLEKTDLVAAAGELKAVFEVLRNVMRERKISYRELAPQVGLSESGLKKIFAARDCSYARVSQLAQALGFTLTDLLVEIERAELKSVCFTSKQQLFLVKNRRAFRFFVKLAVERQPTAQIQKEFGLSPKETFGLLKTLDDLGLVRLLPENRVQLPPLLHVKDFGPGPLAAVQTFLAEPAGKEFTQDFAREAMIMTFNPGGWLRKK